MSSYVNRRILKNLKSNIVAWSYLLPFVVVFSLFMIYPLINGIDLSLHRKTFFSGYKFIGLGNYQAILSDPIFIQDFFNVLYFTIATVLIYTPSALLIAVLFNRKGKFVYIMRSFVIAPLVLSVTVTGIIWQLLFTSGPGAKLISGIFGQGITILNEPHLAMWSIIIATFWWTLGGNIIIFLAALQQVPKEYYEAAMVDGASSIRRFFSITIPLLKPVITVVVILQSIASFKLFGQPYVMTGGGPYNSTATPTMYIYHYLVPNLGYAAAASMILFFIILFVSFIEIFAIGRASR